MKNNQELQNEQTANEPKSGQQYVLLNKSEDREIYFKLIDDTPFAIAHDSEKGYTIILGNQQVIKGFKETEEECLQIINEMNWPLLAASIVALARKVSEQTYYELKSKEEK